jgi:hypothetical protein
MKAIRNIATLAAVAMMFATLGANRASAQAFQGSFQLPFEARWGSVNLPPNRYTFEIGRSAWSEHVGRGDIVVLSSLAKDGHRVSYVIWGQIDDPPSSTGENVLLCQRHGSVYVVRTLRLGAVGETLSFPVPKSVLIESEKRGHKKHKLQAGAVQTVPITISRK